MAPFATRPLAVTAVGAPLLVKVAVPVGMVCGDQLLFSSHSLASPGLPPIQVASCARAPATPNAVVASSTASDCRSAERFLLFAVRMVGSIMGLFSNRFERGNQLTRATGGSAKARSTGMMLPPLPTP